MEVYKSAKLAPRPTDPDFFGQSLESAEPGVQKREDVEANLRALVVEQHQQIVDLSNFMKLVDFKLPLMAQTPAATIMNSTMLALLTSVQGKGG
eukprot:14489901-Alexandrium_andersonii.AAC.1